MAPFPFRDGLFLLVVALLMIPVRRVHPAAQAVRPDRAAQQLRRDLADPHRVRPAVRDLPVTQLFITLPRDLIEAARIDGSTTIGIFRTIVVPLSVPAIAAYGIFQFLWVWNDLLMALVFVQDGKAWPMTKAIQNLLSQYGTEWHLLAAGASSSWPSRCSCSSACSATSSGGLLAGSVK